MKRELFAVFRAVVLVALFGAQLAVGKDNRQEEAAALFARAAEVSNLRAPGSPPFRLRAKVRLSGLLGEPIDGSYQLIWNSPEQWREEITFPSFTQLRVGGAGKLWHRRNVNYLPLPIYHLMLLLDFQSRLKLGPTESVKKIHQRKRNGIRMKCIEMKGKRHRIPSYLIAQGPRPMFEFEPGREMCFDSVVGTLIREEQPDSQRGLIKLYEHADYATWGEKRVPYTLRLLESDKAIVEFWVEQLGDEPSPDRALFSPPEDAEEWAWCRNPEPAKELQRVEPRYPKKARSNLRTGVVFLYAKIGVDGTVHNTMVVGSSAREFPEFDAASQEALRQWRFQPARCGDIPVPTEGIFEFVYRLY